MDTSLKKYDEQLRDKVVGDDADQIIGDPIGRDALLRELTYEMICYTPDELIEIANREFAWCEAEIAARPRGNWATATTGRRRWNTSRTSTSHPGEQPELIRQQALAAIRFLDDHDLVTIPTLCRTSWRIAMMSPERQRVNPYFTGGEVISVSFPTDGMTHEEKLMSLRSNNIHFCWATVHHELIPGHHLQGFMAATLSQPSPVVPHAVLGRRLGTVLGNAVVGHELSTLAGRPHRHAVLANAPLCSDSPVTGLPPGTARRRRRWWIFWSTVSVTNAGPRKPKCDAGSEGDYGPLYQAAYMLGGLQLRALHANWSAPARCPIANSTTPCFVKTRSR